MFEILRRAVASTERANLDALSAAVIKEWGNGSISEDEYVSLAEMIGRARTTVFPPRPRRKRKTRTQIELAHRRGLANTGPMPSHLAAAFTTCELAVLAILTFEGGYFDKPIMNWRKRADVGHSTVQKTLRKAEMMGLISIERRPVRGQKSLPNIVRVISKEWLTWIRRGGSKKLKPIDTRYINSCNERVPNPHKLQWKRLISRTSPGQCAIQSPQRR
ncbi:hypothetical protein ASG58_20990 [Rhizobium sp. Leaf383]|nr:hypothetical protein ASG58_20990 [Rhizobium sp. Leaf383]